VKKQGTRTQARVRLLMRGDHRVAWTGPLLLLFHGRSELPRGDRLHCLHLTLGQAVHLGNVFPNVSVDIVAARIIRLTSNQTLQAPTCTIPSNPRTPQGRSIQRGTTSTTKHGQSAGARSRRKRWCPDYKGCHPGMKNRGHWSYTKEYTAEVSRSADHHEEPASVLFLSTFLRYAQPIKSTHRDYKNNKM
jgi:hypothetical protein